MDPMGERMCGDLLVVVLLCWCRGSGAGAVHSLTGVLCWTGAGKCGMVVWLMASAAVVSPGHREEPRNLLGARVIPCTTEDCDDGGVVVVCAGAAVDIHVCCSWAGTVADVRVL